MSTLETIKGIKPENRELLEAVGWVDPRQFAKANAEDVRAELVKANGVLKLVESVPNVEAVQSWITEAQGVTGESPVEPEEEKSDTLDLHAEPAAADTGPVNHEKDPDVLEMLKAAPLAIPIPNKLLAEKGIPPADIAIAPVLNYAECDLEVRVTSTQRPVGSRVANNSPKGRHAGVVKVADSARNAADGSKRALDISRVRAMEVPEEDESPHPEKRRQTRDERLTLLRTTRESTNRGKKPGTRSYIRGVLHDRPYQVWFGCLVVILFQITVPLSIVAAVLLMITEHSPQKLEWVPAWIIAFPLALPVLGILYFMISFNVKCRVCGQKVLVHRQCRKNSKAHHVWGLGYILPLAVQTLLFRWFHCTFCGTSLRIKE